MCSYPILSTERLVLRGWRHSDRVPFARMNADPQVMEFLPQVLSSPESDLLAERIDAHFRQHGFGLCAAELRRDGTFIGFIGLNVPLFQAAFTPCVEKSYVTDLRRWVCERYCRSPYLRMLDRVA